MAIQVVTAVVDPYAAVSLLAVVVPGAGAARPFWVALGALSLDVSPRSS